MLIKLNYGSKLANAYKAKLLIELGFLFINVW